MSLSARPPPITTYDKTTNIYLLVTFCTDNSVYAKFKNEKFIFYILCIDDILLTSSDVNMSLEKKFLSSSCNMNDLGEVEIHRDRRKWVLGLSQRHT